MSGLLLHRGGQLVSKAELDFVPLPEQTATYQPVSHFQLAEKMLTLTTDLLKDYALIGENYALARQGNQMFAVLKFQQERDDMALSVAFRNSYDKSMSVGFCVGATVFVCDNLALSGEVVVMRRHTPNVWTDLEKTAIPILYHSHHRYASVKADAKMLAGKELSDTEAFKLMGLLYGRGIISPRQLTTLKDEWLKPSHPEFQPRNAWSLYNGATEALKTCPPLDIMERHIELHQTLTGVWH
jgi:hypothetical protein